MIENSIIYTILGMCVVIAIIGMIYFYFEHNAKNDLTFADNKINPKWIIGSILGGLFAGGMTIWYLTYQPEMPIEQIMAEYGVWIGVFAFVMSKVGCEGISGAIKYFAQKKKEADDTAKEEGIDYTTIIKGLQEDNAKMKQMLGIKEQE